MRYAYTDAVILLTDGNEMKPVSGYTLLCEDGKIESIIPDTEEFSSDKTFSLNGGYIVPGLINMHVHLPANGKPRKRPRDNAKTVRLMTSNALLRRAAFNICAGYAREELYSGVTTIRTVGGIIDIDSRLRDSINAGKLIGPRILASDMAVSVPGGHMAGSLAREAHSAAEAAQYTEKIAAAKPDLIKLMITGGVLDAKKPGEPGEMKMPPEYIKAACDAAHKLGIKVAAHAESTQGVLEALRAGVDSIEHGASPTDEILSLFKSRGAFLVTTLSPALPYALFDRSVSLASETEQYNGKIVFEGIIDCAKACLQNGIPVGLGTDTGCPYITHYDMWREVNYFAKYCGVSNSFALFTATHGNASLLGIDGETGSIAAGKSADFFVTEQNPLEDLSALRAPLFVSKGETVIENPLSKLHKMKNVEAELDKFTDAGENL